MIEHAAKALAAGLVGLLLGWASNALTLAPRVEAIEKGQARIEAQLVQLVNQKAARADRP